MRNQILVNLINKFFLILFFLNIPLLLLAQNSLWQKVEESEIPNVGVRYIVPTSYLTLKLDLKQMSKILSQAPMTRTPEVKTKPTFLDIPWPDGSIKTFQIIESPVMEKGLMDKFPEIKTYAGSEVDDHSKYIKLDLTPQGFHAMILTAGEGTVYIDPYSFGGGDLENYICYFKHDFRSSEDKKMVCDVIGNPVNIDDFNPGIKASSSFGSCDLRTYRLAVSATGEYTTFHGGTVPLAQAAQVTTMNRVNGVYERDMAVHMNIIANNDLIIYTNSATDPFSNGNTGAMINENQTNTDNVIGSANYDIGHIFGTNSGGLAGLGVVCSGSKARGVTGSSAPIGDPFDIDYVAHEIGHQFDANHTQYNSCNRNNATAMEPGSASTIMGYAGICAPNVQSNSDDHFHGVSLGEIGAFVTSSGGTCAVTTTLTNSAPTITGTNAGVTVPGSTPFALTCIASDPNGTNILSYCWEQMNNSGNATQPPVPTNTQGPNFRSNSPDINPTRYFPNLNDLAAGVTPTWEVLSSVSRTMDFRVSVRDNDPGAGCTDEADVTITVDGNSGPFVVTYPSATGITWTGNMSETVTWTVGGTDVSPVSCSNVDIYLSTDGGLTFPTLLASNVANDGSQLVTVPNVPTTTARIMVICSNGTFFDISDNDFTIVASTFDYTITVTPTSLNVCSPNSASYQIDIGSVGGYNDPVNLSVSGVPTGGIASFSNSTVTPVGVSALTVSNIASVAPGTFTLTLIANSTSGTKQQALLLTVSDTTTPVILLTPTDGVAGISVSSTFNWSAASGSGVTYEIDIATDSSFTTIIDNAIGLSANTYLSNVLSSNTTYFWRVRASNSCGTAPFSNTFSFTTNNCSIFLSTDIPVAISASGTPTVSSVLNIPISGPISDVNVVGLTGAHTWISDLTVTLDGPQGLSNVLWSEICNDENDFDVNFDDAAISPTLPCPPTGSGTYQPEEPLSVYNGTDPFGNWTLTISDDENNDGGSLLTWGLEVCTGITNPPTAAFSPSSFTSCIATISFTDSSYNIPQSWFWDFGDGNTDTTRNPTHIYTSSGTYTVKLVVSNTIGTDSTTQQLTITLPSVPVVSDVEVCPGDTAFVIASVSGVAQWRDSSNGIIHNGDTLIIPNVATSEVYYVENVVANPSQYIGPLNTNIGGGNYHSSGYHGALNFTALQSFEIVSAWVDADGAGPRTITLASGVNNNGNPPGTGIAQVTVNLVDGPQRVNLNIIVPAAGDYNIGGNNVDLYRNNSGAGYPYTLPGFMTINNSSATTNPTGYYYYLYDIEVREPNCISAQDTVTVSPVISNFTYVDNGGTVTFTDASTGATSWLWDFGDNSSSTLQNPVHTYTNPGTYTITLTINNGACSSTQTFSVLLGLSNISNQSPDLNIVPNPTNGLTKVVLDKALNFDLTIKILDITGKRIKTARIEKGKSFVEVDLSIFPAAVYSVQINGRSFSTTRKIIVY